MQNTSYHAVLSLFHCPQISIGNVIMLLQEERPLRTKQDALFHFKWGLIHCTQNAASFGKQFPRHPPKRLDRCTNHDMGDRGRGLEGILIWL